MARSTDEMTLAGSPSTPEKTGEAAPASSTSSSSASNDVGHIRPAHASASRVDVPQLKSFRQYPGPLYFLSYASKGDLGLYLIGSLCALFSALPYSGLDLVYGRWTSGLVTPLSDGSPPGPTEIRAASREAALIMIGITLGMWILPAGFFFCMSLASSRVVARIRRAYLAAVLAQDATYFESIGPGEVASRLQKDIGMLQAGIGERLGFILWSASGIICGITVSLWASPRVGGVLFSILPAATIIFVASSKLSSRASDRMDKTAGSASSFLEQVISSIRIVKVFQASDPLVRVYDDHLRDIQRDGRFIAFAKGLTYAGSYFFIFICYALVFWYGGRRVAWHGLDVGRLMTCFFSMFNAMFSIVNILPHITGFHDAIFAQMRIEKEIDRVSSIDHREGKGVATFATGSEKDVDTEGLEIELRNVTFAFPSRLNHKSLDDVSLIIPKGKITALVGASGSGKSTITALLLRQYDLPNPTSTTSNIFIQSHPISSLSIRFLRSNIAIVSQEPQLLSGSILENVSVGLTGTADELKVDRSNIEEVEALCRAALEAAQAWEFVQRLPLGVHTLLVGGKTGLLSGGQKQRIAVARALVRRPRILVMDEATSALDSQTEGRLQKALAVEQQERGMTVILIAHRLSTVRDADKIIVMAAGKKIEEGTHESLVAAEGAYHTMLQRHHGIIPTDTSVPTSDHHDPAADQVAAHSELALDPIGAPAAPHHMPMAPPDLKHTASSHPTTEPLHRPATRPGGAGYSFGLQQAEEAQASVDRAESDSSTTRKEQYRRFLKYIGEQKRWVIPGLACSLVIGAAFPVTGYLTGLVVHALALDDVRRVASESARYAAIFLGIAIAILVLCFGEGLFLESGAQRLSRRMRKTATDAVLRQEVGYFDQEENGAGGLTAAIGNHPSQVSTATGLVTGQIVVSLANVLGSVILGLYLSWDLFLVAFSPLVLLVPVGLLEIIYFGKYESEGEKPMVKATSYASESIDAVKTISAFGREGYVVEEFDRFQQPDIKAHRRSLALGSTLFGLGQACIPFLITLIFYYGGEKYARNTISLVTLYAVFESACIGAFSVGKMFTFIGDISRAVHSWRSFSKWIERMPLVAKIAPKSSGGEKSMGGSGGAEIVFKKVELVYPTRKERPAIHELDLHIRPGEKVAFCGPSGGGKSSVLGLLARFYESSRGTITVDGEDIRASPLEEHYGRIALVSQDAQLYEGTVAFNLTLGLTRPVDDKELRFACEQACILDFILTLDEGFQAQIGMKGLALSGGQRQRLCIARALLRNAKILLLDEATSALDNASESLVQQALDRASEGRTTITIAHRLSTIRDADRIYVLEDGRVVETGSHDELIRKGGRYVELVEAQL